MNIIKYPLKEDQYYKSVYKKTQIVLHHTASNSSAKNVIDGWNSNSNRVGTAYVIDNTGVIWEAFDPKYYASAVGYYILDSTGKPIKGNQKAYDLLPSTANRATNLSIEGRSIQIELTNWGNLTLKNNKYYNYVGGEVKSEEVEKLSTPFRGFTYFQKYSTAQLQSMCELIKDLGAKFNIPLKFSQSFEFDKNAVLGVPGLTLHSNYRFDKCDLYPGIEVIKTLKQFV